MTNKQIIIEDYFNIMRDDYGRIYCIQDIGNSKELIKAIREQNEYIQRKEQECEKLKEEVFLLKESNSKLQQIENSKSIEKFYLQQLDKLKAENKHLNELLNQALKDYDRTLNALAEIKEIAEKNNKTEEELFKIRHSRLPKFSMGALYGRHNLASEILQKINEVEDDKSNN